LKILH